MANFATKTPKIVTLAVLALASASDERTNRNNQKRWYVAQGSKCYFTLAKFSAETSNTATVALLVLASLSGKRTITFAVMSLKEI